MARNGERQKQWRSRPENKASERQRDRLRYKTDPKVRTRKKTQCAKRRGRIAKGVCLICGTKKNIELHHPDYEKPMLFVRLCVTCHRGLHMRLRKQAVNN